jgi:CDP-glycerol glycerophosphotransferase
VVSRAARYLTGLGIALRARLSRGRTVPGLLSVVVPAHNVELYIGEALSSIRRQPYREVEIIVVDDGSSDGTVRIARAHRRRDPRVRIVGRSNGGPSAARNTGVAAAAGEFLAFLDPDDLVRADAYASSIATLEETGSDFAVFSYDRMENGRRRRPGRWITAAHAVRRLNCTLDEAPDIQVNAVVWSKVFRRSFYDDARIHFPEGMIYEDQPVSARAFARARAFDVLTEVGVTWRIRPEGTSITQQTATADNIAAHNRAVRMSLAELDEAGHATAADARALQLLANNMRLFSRHVDTADMDFWHALQTGLRDLMARVTPDEYIREVPAQEKVLNALILNDDRPRATEFLAVGGMDVDRFPSGVLPDGRNIVQLPFHDVPDAGVPAEAFVLARRQLPAAADA